MTEETYQRYFIKKVNVLTILKVMWLDNPTINIQRHGDYLYGLITGLR